MFRVLPFQGGNPREISEVVNNILRGKTNNTGYVTLSSGGATQTTLYDEKISPESKIILIPASENAFADSAPYGSFSNNTDQVAPSVEVSAVVEFDTTELANGIFLDNDTEIHVTNKGVYNAQFSMQLANYANTQEYADVWFRVNGDDVPRSASRFEIKERKSEGVATHLIGTVNVFLDLEAGDYIELAGAVSSVDVTLEHFAADTGIPRPAIPAVIFTVQYVAPTAYSNIYVTNQVKGEATINHYANELSDKTYAYIIIG